MAWRPVSWGVARIALRALSRGASIDEAAALAGISPRSVDNLVAREHPVVLREHKARPGSLVLADREEIRVGIVRGEPDAAIATRLGFVRSSIHREISNNGGRDDYRAHVAQARADEQARRIKPRWFQQRPWLWDDVLEQLREGWSPQQIAERLRLDHPDESQWWVSHEAIYQAIYVHAKGELRKELKALLRTGRPARKPQGRAPRSASKIPNMVPIIERPDEVLERLVVGDWEGDLIVGKNSRSYVATLVERVTRFGMLVKIDTKDADHVAERVGAYFANLPTLLARSLTCGAH
jgi:IS30 family transposase